MLNTSGNRAQMDVPFFFETNQIIDKTDLEIANIYICKKNNNFKFKRKKFN